MVVASVESPGHTSCLVALSSVSVSEARSDPVSCSERGERERERDRGREVSSPWRLERQGERKGEREGLGERKEVSECERERERHDCS